MGRFFWPAKLTSSPRLQRLARSRATQLILAVAGVEAGIIGWSYWSESSLLKANENSCEVVKSYGAAHTWWPFDSPGVIKPPTVEAGKASLRDHEQVIGVAVDGKVRAYRVAALRDLNQHIVNDKINNQPVSVLFCDLTDCCRVYTGDSGGEPLPIRMNGLMDGDMIVNVEGIDYRQSSAEAVGSSDKKDIIPFPPLAFVRTTWGEWKKLHPKTDVFLGVVPDKDTPDAKNPRTSNLPQPELPKTIAKP